MSKKFVPRDISWLYFNQRVLLEAGNPKLPLLERLNFLSIYSSNLDEFYKVRIPALLAIKKIDKEKGDAENSKKILLQIEQMIGAQQELFGKTLKTIIPALQENNIFLYYNQPITEQEIINTAKKYFYQHILTYLVITACTKENKGFFPVNNQLYFFIESTDLQNSTNHHILNIPGNKIPRFYTITLKDGSTHILFIDDIIRLFIGELFNDSSIKHISSFKITRNADLNLADEYEGDLLTEIENLIQHRNSGLATRLLHAPDLPIETLNKLLAFLEIKNANIVPGGVYHHLSDFNQIKVNDKNLYYSGWKSTQQFHEKIFTALSKNDIIIHTPFDAYDTVLQFFNEAAFDSKVTDIYVTLYRVAKKSAIVESLISAAKNGKKVYVLIELKARFDEENNIKWAKKLKAAGVKVVYTKASLKVHAKTVLVRRKENNTKVNYGIFATGNFNEITARFYTDHILLTKQADLLAELHLLFRFLTEGNPDKTGIRFDQLLVSQFNLPEGFFALIDKEIKNAAEGLPAEIFIKLNNLEEKKLIKKLIEAAEKGVTVKLIVRSICCINPDIHPNISVRRIVDRFLEHGRIFIFHQNGNSETYIGSADWMNRNIYKRIEVCVPVKDQAIRNNIQKMMNTYWNDDVQGVRIARDGSNLPGEHFHQQGISAQTRLQSLLNEQVNE